MYNSPFNSEHKINEWNEVSGIRCCVHLVRSPFMFKGFIEIPKSNSRQINPNKYLFNYKMEDENYIIYGFDDIAESLVIKRLNQIVGNLY